MKQQRITKPILMARPIVYDLQRTILLKRFLVILEIYKNKEKVVKREKDFHQLKYIVKS